MAKLNLIDDSEEHRQHLSKEIYRKRQSENLIFFAVFVVLLVVVLVAGLPLVSVCLGVLLPLIPIAAVVACVVGVFFALRNRIKYATYRLHEEKSVKSNGDGLSSRPNYGANSAAVEFTHLCVLLHGLWGKKSDLVHMAEVLSATHPTVLTYVADCNVGKTHDGVRAGGERITNLIANRQFPQAERLSADYMVSFIGHSLGGLYARYCIGRLHELHFFKNHEPMNFITFATPHLGIRANGLMIQWFSWLALGATGREMMLRDGDHQSLPVLLEMTVPSSPFYAALALFGRRAAYANIVGDTSVPFCTSAMRPASKYSAPGAKPREQGVVRTTVDKAIMKDPRKSDQGAGPSTGTSPYTAPKGSPRGVEKTLALESDLSKTLSSRGYYNGIFPQYTGVADCMLRELDKLSWIRSDVWLPFTVLPFAPSHESIIAHRNSSRHRRGRQVCQHALKLFIVDPMDSELPKSGKKQRRLSSSSSPSRANTSDEYLAATALHNAL